MAENSNDEPSPGLPPKLGARKIKPAGAETDGASKPTPAPAAPPSGTPKPSAGVTKIAMDTAKPVDGVQSAPRVSTLQPKKAPAPPVSAKAGPPKPAVVKPPAAKPVIVSKPSAAAKVSEKSGTVRISLEETTLPAKPATGAAPGGAKDGDGVVKIAMDTVTPAPAAKAAPAASAETIRAKKPSEAAVKPVAVKPAKPAADETPKPVAPKPDAASPDKGPSTIRLKKPTSSKPVKKPAKPDGITKTARITLDDDDAVEPDKTAETAAAAAAPTGGPKTIRIKRPDEAATAKKVTAPTMKVRRAGAAEGDEDEAPVTQRKTIGVKRRTEGSSERSSRLAEQEEILMKGRGKSSDGSATPASPEKRAWAWCLLSIAAAIVIGFVIWMFCVQLIPKHEKMNWWGRILGYKDAYFDGEIDWLTGVQQYQPPAAPPPGG